MLTFFFVHMRSRSVASVPPHTTQDKRIPKEKRERFEALDLDVLLAEFRAVAATVAAQEADDEEADAGGDDDAETVTTPGADEMEWLREAGFPSLVETHLAGYRIGENQVRGKIDVLSPEMAETVRKRVAVLNSLLPPDAKEAATAASSAGAAGQQRPETEGPADSPDGPAESPDRPKTPPLGPTVGLSSSPPTSGPTMGPRVARSSSQPPFRAGSGEADADEGQYEDVPTQFDDLGAVDQAQLQFLNVVHLTTILESKKIFKISKLAKKKKVKKGMEHCLFGVNLEHLVERDSRLHPEKVVRANVPVILSTIIDFLRANALDEEGVFRKAGHVGRIKLLRQKCEESFGDIDLDAEGARPHDVAALLKQFLRETPEPLLTSQYVAFHLFSTNMLSYRLVD